MSTPKITVCEADRIAAAEIAPPSLRAGILSGTMDKGKYVRAFAAHRNRAWTLPDPAQDQSAPDDRPADVSATVREQTEMERDE